MHPEVAQTQYEAVRKDVTVSKYEAGWTQDTNLGLGTIARGTFVTSIALLADSCLHLFGEGISPVLQWNRQIADLTHIKVTSARHE